MGRVSVSVTDEVEARLEALAKETGLTKQSVFLSALAQYRLDVVAKPKRKATTKEEPKLGAGRRPKDLEEVIKYFRERGVPEPVEAKADIFYEHYQSNDWKVQGRAIARWGNCLAKFYDRHPDWRPVKKDEEPKISLKKFQQWVVDNRPQWKHKLAGATTMEEIDEFYIDEYRSNRF
jgi:predicted transcriptional regulator